MNKQMLIKILKLFEIQNLVWIILVILGLYFLTKYLYMEYTREKNKMKYLVRKDKKTMLHIVTKHLTKNATIKEILRRVAIKIGMFTEYSYQKNLEFATATIIGSSFVSIFAIAVLLHLQGGSLWYIALFYFIIAIIIIVILFYIFFAMARMNFITKLPDTYKILNSRYISKGNILKAINVSLDDFDKVIRKEMIKIYNVLKKNNMAEIDYILENIDMTYSNQYLTILLSLIKQAHYKGGSDMIKEQFETLTEEILEEIENKKDLSSASRSYIIMSVFIPFTMPILKKFNIGAIGVKASEFYNSPIGIKLPIFIIVAMLIYMGFLLVLERSA